MIMVPLRSRICTFMVAMIICLLVISSNGQTPSFESTVQPSAQATPSFQPTNAPTFLTVTQQPTAKATTDQPTMVAQKGTTDQPTSKATSNQPTNANQFLVQTNQPTAMVTQPGQTYQPTAGVSTSVGTEAPTIAGQTYAPTTTTTTIVGNVGTGVVGTPTFRPSKAPVRPPTRNPNFQPPPTRRPTLAPVGPSRKPTPRPSKKPTAKPVTRAPTTTARPTTTRSPTTTSRPTAFMPTPRPSRAPTMEPTASGQVAVAKIEVTQAVFGVSLTTMRSDKFQNYVANVVSQILEGQLPAGNYKPKDVNVTNVIMTTAAVPATSKTVAIPAQYSIKYVITKPNGNPANIQKVFSNVNFFSRRKLSILDNLLAKKYPGASVGLPIIRDISPTTTVAKPSLSPGAIAGIVIAGCAVIVLIVLLSIFIPKMRNAMYSQNAKLHQLQLQNLGAAQVYEVRV